VGKDRGEITVAEPPGVSAHLQRLLDLLGAVELREVDRLARLAPHTLRARSGSLDQPPLRSRADREERPLISAAGTRRALKRTRRAGG